MKQLLAAISLALLAVLALGAAPPSGTVVRVDHIDPATTPSLGPANAPVTVELFFAPTINASVRMTAYRHLEQLQKRHPTRVRILYRVVSRGGMTSGPQLPTLALEAYAQGRFFELLAALHDQRTMLTREQLLDLATSVGLDRERADRAITEGRYAAVIEANERRLDRLGVRHAPTVVFNGQPIRSAVQALTEADYERAYVDAYERAQELLDRGVARADLMKVFDDEALRHEQPLVDDQPLADPPLDLTGLPSLGAPDAHSALPLVIVCRPNEGRCLHLLREARVLHNMYRGEIRIVWAPWFDVTRADTADLSLLADAALCAEKLGSNPNDLDASAGWQWVTETLSQLARAQGRRMSPERLIDNVAAQLQVDSRQLSACRARIANTALAWVERARRSGVTSAPAVVIGGRIFHGLAARGLIQQLVEAELAPGLLGRCATTGC
jgi:protein-disulfide isomerase